MDLTLFAADAPGDLVPISGIDADRGVWRHQAFVPHPLPTVAPELSAATHRAVADARAALAALDSTTRRLPDPRLFRTPSLQAEAQSTTALEGVHAPLAEVLVADEFRPSTLEVREVVNYVATATEAFRWIEEGRPLTVGLIGDLQDVLAHKTPKENTAFGPVRNYQLVIGRRPDAAPEELPVPAARFVPASPGLALRERLEGLLEWMADKDLVEEIDPVVAAALAHYQFEALHPCHHGNGRIGRLLIVVHLVYHDVLLEPTLIVSPWFAARCDEYRDRLLAVSTRGEWSSYVRFFADGLASSARSTHDRLITLVDVQASLRERVRRSAVRADAAHALIDYAIANVSFTAGGVERDLRIPSGRATALVHQLVALGVLAPLGQGVWSGRRYYAPEVVDALVDRSAPSLPAPEPG